MARGKLEQLRLDDLPPWEDALKRYLIEKGHLPIESAVTPAC
jgi:hypothetical protein